MNFIDPDLRAVKKIGEGAFGKVILCRTVKDNLNVCVKQIEIKGNAEMNSILREIHIISQLHHPGIIEYIRHFSVGNTMNIVTEYAVNGSLKDLMRSNIRFTPAEILSFFCDILMGIEYLHIRHVIHRDLKPDNVLVDKNRRLKICDFGISNVYSIGKRILVNGTPYYMAPEAMAEVRSDSYAFKVDIWSLGCILYELYVGQNPFIHFKTFEQLRNFLWNTNEICVSCNKIKNNIWMETCQMMLTYNKTNRADIPKIIRCNQGLALHFYKSYFRYYK